MRIYVDELPQTCLDCENVLCEHQIIEACYATRHPDCPLLSLADYTKQVRKEVCEEIKFHSVYCHINGEVYYKLYPTVLEEIEKGE